MKRIEIIKLAARPRRCSDADLDGTLVETDQPGYYTTQYQVYPRGVNACSCRGQG
jgi:hypothetical protein